MSIFFTSDLHFGHQNIIRFDNRPFTSVAEMDVEIVRRWNAKVTDEDTVYILGDISWHNPQRTAAIIKSLKGHKILIKGNHDRLNGELRACFEEVVDYKEITLDGNKHIVLCHYPIVFFNRHHYGAYMLYGHVHNSHEWQMTENYKYELEQLDIKCNMFNVGCMVWNYEPVTLDEILAKNN
jgi:calcineurin-like phosphoesterase family protein